MSRIGNKPIDIPKGVEVKVLEGNLVKVKGPKGQLEKKLPSSMIIEIKDSKVFVKRPDDSKQMKSLHGLTRSLINNMVIGVEKEFVNTMVLKGMGYRVMKSKKNKDGITLHLGFSNPVEVTPCEGIRFEVLKNNSFKIIGIDKELVGQQTADIRKLRPPEPYKGKGILFEGEKVRIKVRKGV